MHRLRYLRYVVERIVEAVAVAGTAGAGVLAAQRLGLASSFHWSLLEGSAGPWPGWSHMVSSGEFAVWPSAAAVLAHLLLGPKQRRPIYLKHPGAMYCYAGLKIDRNTGCRGGFVTGATGAGKTLACILPRLHSLCINESGVERPEWPASAAGREYKRLEAEHGRRWNAHQAEMSRLASARSAAETRRTRAALGEPLARNREMTTDPDDEIAVLDSKIGELEQIDDANRQAFQSSSEPLRRARYQMPPWGGFICGEKGNEWQAMETLLRYHQRPNDLCILRTRPSWAPPHWIPPVRLNLLSLESVTADTYAKMIVETGLSAEEAAGRDEFFVPQARDKIAWGLRLIRAVQATPEKTPAPAPSLLTLLEILTVQESYRNYLLACSRRMSMEPASDALTEARFQLENNYWNQPPEQLGGVKSTVYNFLVPFIEPEIAEVFCADSTFQLSQIQHGRVVCLAIPQKFAVQRRYVATLLKSLVYQIVLQRFDRRPDDPEWLNRNIILVEQDEWQRHAVQADCEVDVVREARGAVYAAAQSQNAVWLKFGSREKASPLIANLRNRWICQAATEECAEESSNLVSGRPTREVSFSHGESGRTTSVSFPERPLLPRRDLRTLPPFHVIFAPAEGPWLFRRCIAMPATADGRIPPWWFGDWNPLHWAAHAIGLPAACGRFRLHPGTAFIPPWRASAPLRAQIRRMVGLDGTFIVLGGKRAAPE